MAGDGASAWESIQAGEAGWMFVQLGSQLEVISPEGPQVADTWASNATDPDEYLSVEHCRLRWGRLSPRVGDELFTNRGNVILRLTNDTSGGVHDIVLPACDHARYEQLGHSGHHRNCADNLRGALRSAKLPPLAQSPLNLFENVRLKADGGLEIAPPLCPPRGSVRLEVRMAALVVVSACPHDLVPTNGTDRNPKPILIRNGRPRSPRITSSENRLERA